MDYRLYIWPRYVLEWAGQTIKLSNLEGAIMARLYGGRQPSRFEIIDSIYGDREDGGPDNPDNVIVVTLHKLRKKLVGSPVNISKNEFGRIRLIPNLMDRIASEVLED